MAALLRYVAVICYTFMAGAGHYQDGLNRSNVDLSNHNGVFIASDGATVGYVTRQTSGADSMVVLVAPGLTGTASAFSDWFARILDVRCVDKLVVIDWRGFGLSRGPWHACAPPDGIAAPSYAGLTTWRLAQDLHELVRHLSLQMEHKKLVLLGHSMGVNILLQLLELHGSNGVSGIILLDDSPRNMDFGTPPVDGSFPEGTDTFSMHTLQHWMHEFTNFDPSIKVPHDVGNASIAEMSSRWQPYFSLNTALLQQFHTSDAHDHNNVTGAFTQTRSGLLKWMRQLGPSNGKIVALLVGNAMQQDLTGAHERIRASRLPFLVYANGNSASPFRAIKWNAEHMSPCNDTLWRKSRLAYGSLVSYCPDRMHLFLEFNGTSGTHCPFLNEDKSQLTFFEVVARFVETIERSLEARVIYS